VKRLLLPFILSLSIHALLMSIDTSWFKRLPPSTPHPNRITISLVGRQPKGDRQTSAANNLSETEKSKQKGSPKKGAEPPEAGIKKTPPIPANQKLETTAVNPSKKVVSPPKTIKKQPEGKKGAPLKKMSAKPEQTAEPHRPPEKTLPQQITVKKETVIREKRSTKRIMPKKSLKKLTKKPPTTPPEKQESPIKPTEINESRSKADRPIPRTAAALPKKSQSEPEPSGQRPAVQQQNNRAKKSPLDGTASAEKFSTLANRGDTSAAPVLIMARPLYRKNPPPKYPMRARKKGYEGNVILEVLVDENGTVEDLKVFKSSGYEILDKSALSSVKKWLFEPANRNGKAMKMWVRVPVRFQLN
jgi:protein TonB